MTITTEMLTRNIAKSGEVLNLGGVSPFGHHLGLIVNRSQSASCHIAQRYNCERKHQSLDYQTPEKLFKKIV